MLSATGSENPRLSLGMTESIFQKHPVQLIPAGTPVLFLQRLTSRGDLRSFFPKTRRVASKRPTQLSNRNELWIAWLMHSTVRTTKQATIDDEICCSLWHPTKWHYNRKIALLIPQSEISHMTAMVVAIV